MSREAWEAELRSYGCKPLEGKGALNTAEWWQYPWGQPFTVPCDDDGICDQWAFLRVITDMAKCAPRDWTFPKKPKPPADPDVN